MGCTDLVLVLFNTRDTKEAGALMAGSLDGCLVAKQESLKSAHCSLQTEFNNVW